VKKRLEWKMILPASAMHTEEEREENCLKQPHSCRVKIISEPSISLLKGDILKGDSAFMDFKREGWEGR
jgi:hypothetical protein